MNIKFHRAGDDVDIALFDINGPVAAQYTVPLRALISALPEDLLDEFWRPQLDDALAQVDNLRAGLEETSRDADRIAEQRDEAREEVARLRAGMEDMCTHSNRMATQRDEVRRQLADAVRQARKLNVTLTRERDEAREERDQASRMAADLAYERDEVRRQMAMMESQRSREIAEYDNQRRSIRALRRTIKELTS